MRTIRFNRGKIERLRIKNKMTRHGFGKALGTVSCNVKSWETGESVPSVKYIEKICNQFNLSPGYFFK